MASWNLGLNSVPKEVSIAVIPDLESEFFGRKFANCTPSIKTSFAESVCARASFKIIKCGDQL